MESKVEDFPYGVYITIFLNGSIQFDLDKFDFDLNNNLSLQFVENKFTTSQFTEVNYSGSQVWDVRLTGFKTACSAEKAGLKLAESLLWYSILKEFPMRMIYNKSLPCTVFDRTKGPSFEVFGFGHRSQIEKGADIVESIKELLFSTQEHLIDRERLLLSMEIYSSSLLEVTSRAKFISLITSLEALSLQKNYIEYTKYIEEKIKELINAINIEDRIPDKIRSSLIGKIKREMSVQSVRQAIFDVIHENTKNPDNKKIFDEAYSARSSLVHDGATEQNIEDLYNKMSSMIREIYSSVIQH